MALSSRTSYKEKPGTRPVSGRHTGDPIPRNSLQQKCLDSLFLALRRKFDLPRNSLVRTFGKPTKVEVHKIKNLYGGGIDTSIIYHFGKTIVDVYVVSQYKKSWVKSVQTTDIDQLSQFGILQDMKLDSLVKLLGPADDNSPVDAKNNVSLTYEIGDVISEYLAFIFHDGKLTKINYQLVEE